MTPRVKVYLEVLALHGRTSKSHQSRLELRLNRIFNHMTAEEREQLKNAQGRR